jgi:hypothetical protein
MARTVRRTTTEELTLALMKYLTLVLKHLKPQFYDFGQPNMFLAQWR